MEHHNVLLCADFLELDEHVLFTTVVSNVTVALAAGAHCEIVSSV